MVRPIATIIEDDRGLRDFYRKSVRIIGEEEGIDFDVVDYDPAGYPDNLGGILNSSLYLIDKKIVDGNSEVDGLELSRKIRGQGGLGSRIMISGFADPEYRNAAVTQKYCEAFLAKPMDLDGIRKAIVDSRKRGELIKPLTLGIVGLGILGEGILKGTDDNRRWAKRIFAYSEHCTAKPGEYEKLRHLHGLSARVDFRNNLEELLEENPEVLVISKAEHGIDHTKYKSREELRKRLLNGSFKRVKPIFEKIQDLNYQGFVINCANPVGDVLSALEQTPEVKLNHRKTTAISTLDAKRAKTIIIDQIGNSHLMDYNFEIPVVGEHGKEIIVWDKCKVNGVVLSKAYPQFENRDLRNLVSRMSREGGLRMMQASDELGKAYTDPQNALINGMLEQIARLQRFPGQWYQHLSIGEMGHRSCFLQWDSELSYGENIGLQAKSPISKSLGNGLYREVREDGVDQHKFVERFLDGRK